MGNACSLLCGGDARTPVVNNAGGEHVQAASVVQPEVTSSVSWVTLPEHSMCEVALFVGRRGGYLYYRRSGERKGVGGVSRIGALAKSWNEAMRSSSLWRAFCAQAGFCATGRGDVPALSASPWQSRALHDSNEGGFTQWWKVLRLANACGSCEGWDSAEVEDEAAGRTTLLMMRLSELEQAVAGRPSEFTWTGLTALRAAVSNLDEEKRRRSANAGEPLAFSLALTCPFFISGEVVLSLLSEIEDGHECQRWILFSASPTDVLVMRLLVLLPSSTASNNGDNAALGLEKPRHVVEVTAEVPPARCGLRVDNPGSKVDPRTLKASKLLWEAAATCEVLPVSFSVGLCKADMSGHPGGSGWIPWKPRPPSIRSFFTWT